MTTIIILMVVIALLCALSFMCQSALMIWLCLKDIANIAAASTEMAKTGRIKNNRLESFRERAEAGQIVDDTKTEGAE